MKLTTSFLKHKELVASSSVRFIGLCSSYLFSYLSIHYYGVTEWGKFSLILATTSYYILVGKFGMDISLLKYVSRLYNSHNSQQASIFYIRSIRSVAFINCFLFLFLIGLLALSKLWFLGELGQNLFYTLFLLLPMVFSIVNAEALRGMGKSMSYIFIQFAGNYLLASLLLFATRFTHAPLSPVWSFILATFIVMLFSFYSIARNLSFSQIALKPLELIDKELWKTNLRFFFSNVWVVLIDWFDLTMVGYCLGYDLAGDYNISLKVANLLLLPNVLLATIVASKYGKLFYESKTEELALLFSQTSRRSLWITSLAFILFALGGSWILEAFGIQGDSVLPVFFILLSGQFIASLLGPTDVLLQMCDQENKLTRILFGACAINMVANTIFVPLFGVTAAAVVFVMTRLYIKLMTLHAIRKDLGLSSF